MSGPHSVDATATPPPGTVRRVGGGPGQVFEAAPVEPAGFYAPRPMGVVATPATHAHSNVTGFFPGAYGAHAMGGAGGYTGHFGPGTPYGGYQQPPVVPPHQLEALMHQQAALQKLVEQQNETMKQQREEMLAMRDEMRKRAQEEPKGPVASASNGASSAAPAAATEGPAAAAAAPASDDDAGPWHVQESRKAKRSKKRKQAKHRPKTGHRKQMKQSESESP